MGSLDAANLAQKNMDPEKLREMKSRAGKLGAKKRNQNLSAKRRKEIAKKAGLANAERYKVENMEYLPHPDEPKEVNKGEQN